MLYLYKNEKNDEIKNKEKKSKKEKIKGLAEFRTANLLITR